MTWLLLGCDPGAIGIAGESIDSSPLDSAELVEAERARCVDPPAVVLNEVVAANAQGLQDASGKEQDWIEVYAGEAVDLEGWGLDDGGDRWVFSSTVVDAGGFVLVFASGKESTGDEVHADFELDALGETIALTMPSGCVVDDVATGRLYADVSYGRAGTEWAYFLDPTPGLANTTESRPGFAGTPSLSPAPGFYDDVTVTVTGEGALVFTLDGSLPEREGSAYAGAIDIDATQPVVVRAQALVDGLWPSRVATGTYSEDPSLLDGGVRVISLAVDPPDLWDDERGIYAYGTDYEYWYPYFGANFWELWERDLHVEIFGADGSAWIAQDAGIQIAGGYSRAFDQRNFELLARSGYGPDTFAYPLFDDEQIGAYERIYLRNGGDWCSTQLVDAAVQGVFRDADGARYPYVDAQAYEPALVFLNGDFWGVYEMKERLDEGYVAAHHGEDPDALDRVKLGWTHDANWELEQGSWAAFEAMETLVASQDLAESDAYAEFAAMVNEKNFASALVAQGWIANTDFWHNNLRLWRPTRDGGEWHWMVYDFGHGWTDYNYDHLSYTTSGTWTGLPVAAALRSDAFRATFVNTHADYLNTTLDGTWARSVVEGLADEVRPVMPMQRERWCGGANMSAWESAVDYAALYAERRGGVVRDDLERVFALDPVSLSIAADGDGAFALTTVTVESGFSGTYYRGVPLTVTPVPAEGWRFAGWDGLDGEALTISMDDDVALVGHFERQ